MYVYVIFNDFVYFNYLIYINIDIDCVLMFIRLSSNYRI